MASARLLLTIRPAFDPVILEDTIAGGLLCARDNGRLLEGIIAGLRLHHDLVDAAQLRSAVESISSASDRATVAAVMAYVAELVAEEGGRPSALAEVASFAVHHGGPPESLARIDAQMLMWLRRAKETSIEPFMSRESWFAPDDDCRRSVLNRAGVLASAPVLAERSRKAASDDDGN